MLRPTDLSKTSGSSPTRRTTKPAAVVSPIAVHPNDLYLLDIPTAAAKMSTTIFAVRELMRSGKLKFVVIGHKWLVSPGAIQEFIRANEQAAA
jgi:hypothetical protein